MPSATSSTRSRAQPGSSPSASAGCAWTAPPLPPPPPTCTSSAPPLSRQAEVGEAAVLDRQLVGRELAVPLDLGGGRLAGRRPGLEVDDDRPAEVVALDPVDPAAEPGPADGRRRTSCSTATSSRRLPASQDASRRDHRLAPGPRSRPATQPVPRSTVGSSRSSRASSASSVLVAASTAPSATACTRLPTFCAAPERVAAADVLEEPPQPAPGEGLDLRRADRDLLLRVADRPVVGELGQPPPAGRVGAAGARGREHGEPGGRRGAEVERRVRAGRGRVARPRPGAGRRPGRSGSAGAATGGQRRAPPPRAAAGRARRGSATAPAPRARWSPRSPAARRARVTAT